MEIIKAKRVFLMNNTRLRDPDPGLSPVEVRDLYAEAYPHLATCEIEEPVCDGEEVVYKFAPAPAKTKG